MRKVTLLFLMLTLVLFLSACSGKDKTVSVFISGDTIPLRYADNLTLVNYPDYTIATLRNPCIIRKSKFPQNPKRSVRFSGKGTKRSVQKRKARNTQKTETKGL